MSVDTKHGFTSKLTIGTHDVYLKTGWHGGRMVHIDMTISRSSGPDAPDSANEKLEQDKFFLARAWVEDSCRMASKLFDRGADADEIVSMWMGVEGYPSGYCPQIGGLVRGPLHAAAAHIKKNHERWQAAMKQAMP
jgi:hypothetical protein